MRQLPLHALFFLSGASALIYELVWQRLLHLVFGVSTLATSAVLAAFMGGLALGGLAFGRLADRTRQPLRCYAVLEAGIALTALLVPPGFALLTDVYTNLYVLLQPSPLAGTLLRFVLSLVVLLGPATLIGGTLPFMGRLTALSGRPLSSTFSLFYAVNTLGSVVGAALTGLVLLRFVGMQQTILVAAAINGVVAFGAILLGNAWRAGGVITDRCANTATSLPSPPEYRGRGEKSTPSARRDFGLALGCAAATGAITTGLEVAWTRVLGVFTSNSTYAFALVLTVLLSGLMLGSLLQALWAWRKGNDWRRLALCQGLLAALTVATLPMFRAAPAWLERCCDGRSIGALFLAELALTAIALFVPAILMGMSFPLLAAGMGCAPHGFGKRLGRLYAANTLGCIAGACLAGFALIPGLGIRNTLGVFAAGNLAVALVAWLRSAWPPRRLYLAGAAIAIALAGVAWHVLPNDGFQKSRVEAPRRLLYYREGNNATVSIVEEPFGVRSLLVDGQPVAGTGATSIADQKMLAHLPLLLHPDPHRALTVGFGSGGTSYSMTLHGVEVDCVEIERAVADAADLFRSENHDIRRHPHFHLIVDDARSWLRVAPKPYDAIVTDCTNLQYKSSGDLYTVEYFELMRRRLTANGIAAAWVPANGIDAADLQTLLRSFRAVFPHTSVWYMNPLATDFLIVVGTPGPLAIDLDQWRRRMEVPAVHADLQTVGLGDPHRLLYTMLNAETDVERYVGRGPLHRDDRPILSYSTYGAAFRTTIAGNLLGLLADRSDAARFVRRPPPGSLLLRHYAASNELSLGHVALLRGQVAEGLHHYVKGAELLPMDRGLQRLVVLTYARFGMTSRDRPGAVRREPSPIAP